MPSLCDADAGYKLVHHFRQLQFTLKVITLGGRLQEKRFKQVKLNLEFENLALNFFAFKI